MTHYPDGSETTMVLQGPYVRAVGWLSIEHDFPKGPTDPEFRRRLRKFAEQWWASTEALGLAIFMGVHECEFCESAGREPAMASGDFGVPCGEILFIAPEMIAHYVEQHDYLPPEDFIAAVMASPLPDHHEYAPLVEKFAQRIRRSLGTPESGQQLM